MTVCRDCGNRRLTTAEVREQMRRADEWWQCPVCAKPAQCVDVPDCAVGTLCLHCRRITTSKSLWDERNRHFFCDPLCVADYEDGIRTAFRANSEKNVRLTRAAEARRQRSAEDPGDADGDARTAVSDR